jgi:hypothetical protein
VTVDRGASAGGVDFVRVACDHNLEGAEKHHVATY